MAPRGVPLQRAKRFTARSAGKPRHVPAFLGVVAYPRAAPRNPLFHEISSSDYRSTDRFYNRGPVMGDAAETRPIS